LPHRVDAPTKGEDTVTQSMKPDRIVIKKLFGQYDHDIALHQDSRVTVLIGINGTGKTTILRMIDRVAKGDFRKLYEEPFGTIGIGSGQAYCEFTKMDGCIRARFRSTVKSSWRSYDVPIEFAGSPEKIRKEILDIEERIEYQNRRLRQLARRSDTEDIEQQIFSAEAERAYLAEMQEHLREQYHRSRYETKRRLVERDTEEEAPAWLNDFLERFHCHLISAERLYRRPSVSSGGRRQRDEPESGSEETVLIYARRLSKEIRKAQQLHSYKSLELNQNFMDEAFGSVEHHLEPKSWDEYKKDLDEIETVEQQLVSTGLLKGTKRAPLPDTLKDRCKEAIVAGVLATYIKGSKEMYSVFTDLLDKITMFTRLVNGHLTNKQIVIGAEEGYVVKLEDGSSLELTQLSSGEQHLIVLAYELIFKVKRGTFVLIDEPELSLHVAWQQDFNDDLRVIGNARDLIFLLATHSTAIVDREWDICYELERP